ncbi:MAG: cytochrome c oxidase subunit II, partial [Chloroflexota bacterium]|nr:cytochrome c oxidase subunit II [Chloroflexota bacterium]
SPEGYFQKVAAFNAGDGNLSVKTPDGIKPKGDDAYIGAVRFSWVPNPLVLDVGRPYRLHLSSRDVNHGFSIHEHDQASQKANFQVLPGYDYVLKMTFDKPGVYDIVCQEYCGAGHQFMVGKIIVQQGGH